MCQEDMLPKIIPIVVWDFLLRAYKHMREKLRKKDPNDTVLASNISLIETIPANELHCGMNQNFAMFPS